LGFGFTDKPAAILAVLPAADSVRWGDGLKTISANGNVAVCGADRRQSETTGLMQEHGLLATAMPRPSMCRRVSHQLILKQ